MSAAPLDGRATTTALSSPEAREGAGTILGAGSDAQFGARQGAGTAAGTGPGAGVLPVALPSAIHDELVAWARSGYPNEACGILAGDGLPGKGGRAVAFHGLTNAAASPLRYLIDAREQLQVMLAIDDADQATWGIFHSHVRSPAEPSPTDIGLAFYPDALYLICSLADQKVPVVRAWSICDGAVTEVPLQVE